MKTLGLIGGMSWESTALYYRMLNEGIRERKGGLHSAPLIIWSFDFSEIENLQARGDWKEATHQLVDVALRLETAGAEALLICTNTMHKMADDIARAVSIPLIHIADTTATEIKRTNCKNPILLATAYTMEEVFYKGHLQNTHDIKVIVPDASGRSQVHHIIYEELCQGIIKPGSKKIYLDIIEGLKDFGADSVIFGCTEVGLLLSQKDLSLPVFDTTELHVAAAIDFSTS